MNVMLLVAVGALVMLGKGASPQARALALKVAADIKSRQYDYSRQLVRDFQSAVGFRGKDVDGIYGPKTRDALARYTTAPKALFKGAT